MKDHPRVCGEKRTFTIILPPAAGSPPRVRGKGGKLEIRAFLHRITPACAGKSISQERCSMRKKGSPPRVRGKVRAGTGRREYPRITPACAGKRLKKAHKIKDFDPVPIRFHLVFRRFERWCSNLPTPDGNVPV